MTEADNANSHLLASTLIRDGYEVRMNRIVVAVDDNAMRSLLVSALFKHGYAVLPIGNEDDLHKYFTDIASTPEEAKRSSCDVVLLDMCAPGKTILDIASSIREVANSCKAQAHLLDKHNSL